MPHFYQGITMSETVDDLLWGAGPIAEFLFGDAKRRRRVYQNSERMPLFYIGAILCGRRSTLQNWLDEQEARGIQPVEKREAGGKRAGQRVQARRRV
jgi:hypothetical protein